MNESRFSAIFIEKRDFSYASSLGAQGVSENFYVTAALDRA